MVREEDGVKWWSSELESLRRKTRDALKKATRNKTPKEWETFRKHRDLYRERIRLAQQKAWTDFCSDISKGKEAARLDKILSKNPDAFLSALQKPDGTYTESDEETLALLIGAHFPGFKCSEEGPDEPQTRSSDQGTTETPQEAHPMELSEEEVVKLVTPASVRWALESFGPFKSPGPDGIYPCLLQKAGHRATGFMVSLMRASLRMYYVPKTWRGTKIIFIPKAGKPSYTSPKDFRPISLTPFLLKTCERLVDKFIRGSTIVNNMMSHNQHAYRPGRSTETALHDAVNLIEGQLEAKGFALATFMDIEGAFNNTSTEVIRKALKKFKIPEPLIRWICHMLANREAATSKGDATIKGRITSGCPQGGVLSPLLWSLVVNSLLTILTQTGANVIGYADDILIIVRGPYLGVLVDLMQKALNLTNNWCQENGLSVNPSKTETVIFTRKYKWKVGKNLHLNGQELTYSTKARYLGVVLDSKLLWKDHVDKLLRSLTATLWQCRRALGTTWGLSPDTMKWIYEAVLRPRLTYASVVWWKRTELATVKKQLEKTRGLILRSITGAMKSTPVSALGVLLDIPLLHIIVKEEAMRSALRIKNQIGWKRTSKHTIILDKVALDHRTLMLSDRITRVHFFDKKYRISLGPAPEWDHTSGELQAEGDVWFTNGSIDAEGAGAGVYRRRNGMGFTIPLGRYPNIFQVEIMGIIQAAYKADEVCSDQSITICSDSRSAISALNKSTTTSRLVLEGHCALNRLSQRNRVTLQWIPGHSGIKGNTVADRLAKQAKKEPFTGPEPAVGLATNIAIDAVRNWAKSEHEKEWTHSNGLKQAKLFLGENFNETKKKFGTKLSRKDAKTLVAIITGHDNLRQHLHRMGISASPLCRYCSEFGETAVHILCDCPVLANTRHARTGITTLEEHALREMGTPELLQLWKALWRAA